jgi:hypothetical protein
MVELPMIRAMWEIPTKELRGVALQIKENRVLGRFLYEIPPGELEQELVDLCEFYLAIDLPDDYDVEFTAEHLPIDQDRVNRDGEHWFYLRYEEEESPDQPRDC